MGVDIFQIGFNRTDLGCWRLTLRNQRNAREQNSKRQNANQNISCKLCIETYRIILATSALKNRNKKGPSFGRPQRKWTEQT